MKEIEAREGCMSYWRAWTWSHELHRSREPWWNLKILSFSNMNWIPAPSTVALGKLHHFSELSFRTSGTGLIIAPASWGWDGLSVSPWGLPTGKPPAQSLCPSQPRKFTGPCRAWTNPCHRKEDQITGWVWTPREGPRGQRPANV